MNITDKNTLKSWFLRGMKPLESQFAAWIDAYWHKSEQIPTSSINGLELTLNNKAEAADIRNLTNEFATHRDDNTRHKTAEEQAKLGNLADNANLTYATKEEIALLENSSAIIIPVDFTKTEEEINTEGCAFWNNINTDDISGKPVYFKIKYVKKTTTETVLMHCESATYNNMGVPNMFQVVLPNAIVTRDEIDAGENEKFQRRITFLPSGIPEGYPFGIFKVTSTAKKSLCLYFIPEGVNTWEWDTYRTAHTGEEISGTLTAYTNEDLVVCDTWSELKSFMTHDYVNENRIPPIYIRTITSGNKEQLKPVTIEVNGVKRNGENVIDGFKLSTSSIEEIDGVRCFIEETLNIPKFTGYGSPYTYKFTITPCNAELKDNSAIIIPVDFTKGTTNLVADLVKLIQPFFDDGTIYKKPVYLQYIYKDDYATPDAPLKYCLVPKTKETRTVILTEYYFNSSVSVSEPDYPEYKDAYCFLFRLTKTNVSVSMRGYTEDVPVEAIYLTENGDYQVDTSDKNWFKLRDELNKGNRPLLSLKTPESGVYCPVTYEFTPVTPATTPVSYQGKMEISYLKETDGVMEMWVETRIFTNFYGAGVYDYPHIKKYPCKPDVRVVTEYPTDLSGVADGTIFIKNPGAV